MLRKTMIIVVLFVLLAGCDSPVQRNMAANTESPMPTGIPPTNVPVLPSAPPLLITDTPRPSAWTLTDDLTSANQIRTMLVDRSGDLWTGGPGGVAHWDSDTGKPTVYATGVFSENTNVVALVQAPDDAIWVGTFGNGIGIFDGASWQSLNPENGLPGSYVNNLTRTGAGEIWATLQKMPYPADEGQSYYFGRFDGTKWIQESGGGFTWIRALSKSSIIGAYNHPFGGYTFSSEVAMYDGQIWRQVAYFPYEYIDAITIAPDDVIWVATQNNVFRIVGRTLHKIKPPWAVDDFVASVTSIAVAEDGTAWFGFSRASFLEYPCGSRWEPDQEQGVYRYDGKTWTHFTTADRLVDNKICAVTLDPRGNVWFGSFDKGVSRFDGHDWKTYQMP